MYISITQTTTPIRFAFFIKANSKVRFSRATEIAFSLWGGIYSPILPLYYKLPTLYKTEYGINLNAKIYYKNILNNYNPDIILFDEDLDENYIKEIAGDRNLIKINNFLEGLISRKLKFGIHINQIVKSIIDSDFKYRRTDNLKIILPRVKDSNLFLKSFLGAVEPSLFEEILDKYGDSNFFEVAEVNNENLGTYLSNKAISLATLNRYKLNSTLSWHSRGILKLYLLDSERLSDLINFWNLRALGQKILPISFSSLSNQNYSSFIDSLILSNYYQPLNKPVLSFLLGSAVSKHQIKLIRSELEEINSRINLEVKYSFQHWFPPYWDAQENLSANEAASSEFFIESQFDQVESKENYIQFQTKKLPFEIVFSPFEQTIYKVNISISYLDHYAEWAGVIYGIKSDDWQQLTQSFGFNKWSLTKSGLNYFVNNKRENVTFKMPYSIDFFRLFFSNKGHYIRENPNGKLAKEVLRNIGGILGTNFINRLENLEIIALFEEGREIIYPQLYDTIKKKLNFDKEQVQSYINRLIQNKIIELGANIQCRICNQRPFYLPKEFDLSMKCSICRNSFELPAYDPAEIKWAYRGIGPFSRNNKVGGLMSVFLTLKLFENSFSNLGGSISTIFGFEISKDQKKYKEVDLAVLLRPSGRDTQPPEFFLCECKTFKRFTKADVERMKELGDEFPNAILTFATLNEELDRNETIEIRKLVNYFRKGVGDRPQNPILILTANELLPTKFRGYFAEYEDQIPSHLKYKDRIGALSELTVAKHLELETWHSLEEKRWRKRLAIRNKQLKEKSE